MRRRKKNKKRILVRLEGGQADNVQFCLDNCNIIKHPKIELLYKPHLFYSTTINPSRTSILLTYIFVDSTLHQLSRRYKIHSKHKDVLFIYTRSSMYYLAKLRKDIAIFREVTDATVALDIIVALPQIKVLNNMD